MKETKIFLDENGQPCFQQGKARKALDFNEIYRGYYPKCTFTAAAKAGNLYDLAGVDTDGKVHLFTSLMGGSWEERNLRAFGPMGQVLEPDSPVVRILWLEEERQTLLICKGGQLVTLPDCPRCVKIRTVCQGPVTDAALEEGQILLTTGDGLNRRIPVCTALQFRVSETFAREKMAHGAILADLRESMEYDRGHLPLAVSVPDSRLGTWLDDRSREDTLIFVCRTGALSDEAARYARSRGYCSCYSLGGMLEMTRVP